MQTFDGNPPSRIGRAAAPGNRRWWTLAAVCTGVFMLLLDITIVNVALPDIENTFGASLSDLQWVISAYALTLAAFLLTAGSLADLYGRRRLFASGIVIFTVGSLFCGVATGSTFLAVARGGQGVGGAIMFATSLALLAQAFQGRDRGLALGLFGAITGVAVAVGPVLGGAIVTGLSWRWIFYVNVPIGIAALAITLLRVDESRNPNAKRPDWAGFVTFSAALAGLVYGLIESQRVDWSSPTVVGSLAASAVLLAVFLVLERIQAEPMLDLGLLRVPTFDGGLAAAWAISAALFAMFTYLTVYLQNSLGLSAVATGVRFLPLTVAIFVAAGVAGRLTSRVPRRLLIAHGLPADRRRAPAHARPDAELRVDAPAGRDDRVRHRRRACQHAADLYRRRRGRAGPGGHGLRDQLDPAPGGYSDGCGRARHDPRLARALVGAHRVARHPAGGTRARDRARGLDRRRRRRDRFDAPAAPWAGGADRPLRPRAGAEHDHADQRRGRLRSSRRLLRPDPRA